MSGQEIGTVVGGIVGAYFGQPQLGMAIGGLIGGAIDPTKIQGPHIGQGQKQTSTDGVPIAWVMGTAKVAGTLCAVGPRYEVKKESGGKGGGPVQVTYEAHQSFAILVCESSQIKDSTINSILMVEQDGKIVYDMRPESNFAEASSKWIANVDFLFGDEEQLPHPKLEAIFGVGKTPAYRDRCLVVFKDFNLTPFGDRIPTYLFTVVSSGGSRDITDFGSDFTASNPGYFEVASNGALLNTHNAGANNVNYRTPILSDPIYLYSEFMLTLLDRGDPMSICITNSANLALFDFMCRAEDQIDPGKQRAYINYITEADRPVPQPWIPLVILSAGVLYSFEAFINLDAGTFNYILKNGGTVLSSGTANIRARTGGPAYLSFNRTGNIGLASVVEYSRVKIVFGADSVALSDVVQKICKRGTLALDYIDASALSSYRVNGYPIATQCSAADALLPALQATFAFGTAVDGKILFKFYGEDVLVSVDDNDAVINDASDGAIQKKVRNQATEFPQKIVGQYIDPAQNYNNVAQQAERLAQTVVATGESDIQIPLAITATQAKQAVDKALKVAYATLEGTLDISVPYATDSANYLSLVAGEPLFQGNKRWVTDEVDIGVNYLKVSGRYDRQSAYTSNVQPITGNTPTPPTSMYSGPTDLMVMNLPSLRSQDTYGVYAAVKGEDTSWRGATIQVSYDEQQSWQNAATATIASVMGIVVSDVASSSSSDEANTIVNVGDDEMSSVTDAQLEANANAFAIVDASNVAEIRQAKYATLQDISSSSSDGENRYLLTRQSTGLLGTDFVLHEAGEKFTMLNAVYFLPIDLSFKGKTLYFRAVGFGEVAEDQPIIDLVYDPDTTVIIDGGEITS